MDRSTMTAWPSYEGSSDADTGSRRSRPLRASAERANPQLQHAPRPSRGLGSLDPPRQGRSARGRLRGHGQRQPSQVSDAAAGGAGRRSTENAAASISQPREAHCPARQLHFPEGQVGAYGLYRSRELGLA